jgi:hypothetical protein
MAYACRGIKRIETLAATPQYYRVVSYVRGKDWLDEDIHLRICEGNNPRYGEGVLSAWSILATVDYVFGVAREGGGETPNFIFVGLWIAILASIGFLRTCNDCWREGLFCSFQRRPGWLSCDLLHFVLSHVVCQRHACITAGSHS